MLLHLRHGQTGHFVNGGKTFAVHVLVQTFDEVVNDAEAAQHHGGADLDRACPGQNMLDRIFRVADAAHAKNRQAGFGAEGADAAQGNRLDRRAAIAAIAALAAHIGQRVDLFDVHADHAQNGVDGRKAVRPARFAGLPDQADVGDVRGQLGENRHGRVLFDPAANHFGQGRVLALFAAHVLFGHTVRAAKIEFDGIRARVLHRLHQLPPAIFFNAVHDAGNNGAVGVGFFEHPDVAQPRLRQGGRKSVRCFQSP